jgi:hypothetical protein
MNNTARRKALTVRVDVQEYSKLLRDSQKKFVSIDALIRLIIQSYYGSR